ncbi:hypothetical protein DPM33_12685 [Mesorhizobium hawassense]|uniref:DUF3606 domain-containing protein n=1 Tax=Mesorhizobium hawassense TaxID=1209954 RepID=A0A330HS25_9HYPH|nr:hypothetical protein [Mesorhizobium hawassense]RAZ90382.1 hypothetical protein DPM33_12685 [Mesorhizobium hawassense]
MAKKKNRQPTSGTAAASRAEIQEAAYFARKCGLTRDEALQLIREAHAPVEKGVQGGKRKH